MKRLAYSLLLFISITQSIFFQAADANQKTLTERLIETLAKGINQELEKNIYVPDANKEIVKKFYIACLRDEEQTVKRMIENGEVRGEDAGMAFINWHQDWYGRTKNPTIGSNCAKSIAQKDAYAPWKAYKKCIEHPMAQSFLSPWHKSKRDKLEMSFVQQSFSEGFIIPQTRVERDIPGTGLFTPAHIPILHVLVVYYPIYSNFLEELLTKGANPHHKANCAIFFEHTYNYHSEEAKKEYSFDIFELIESRRNKPLEAVSVAISSDGLNKLKALCERFTQTPIDTKNQFYPSSPFFTNETNLYIDDAKSF